MPEHTKIYLRIGNVALAAAALVSATALLVLVGWGLGSEVLKSGVPGLVAMNPLTAVLFLCSAVALAISTTSSTSRGRQQVSAGLSLFVVLAGFVALGDYLSLWSLHIDRALFTESLGDNRMAPNTALQFVLLGTALLLMDLRLSWFRGVNEALMLAVLVGATMSLVGYSYGARHLYGIGVHIPMALNSAALFELMALGLICARLDRSMFAVLASPDGGGVMARRLLPAALLIPLVLGFIRLIGQRAEWYDTEFGAALMVVVTIVLLVSAILITAASLNRSDAERRQTLDALRSSEKRFRFLADSMPQMIWTAAPNGDLEYYNQRWYDYTGMTFEQAKGWGWQPVLHPNDLQRCIDVWTNALRTGEPFQMELRLKRADGTHRWHLARGLPERSSNGTVVRWVGTCTDVDDQKRAGEQIRELNDELEHRIEERTAELVQVNRDLTQKNQENEMFVYSVSHDLRSPLVSLQGFSRELGSVSVELHQLLSGDSATGEPKQRALDLIDGDMRQSIRFIQSATLRLSTIIDALLRLSRVGRVEYSPRTLDVNQLLARLVESLAGELYDRSATIRIADLPACHGDATAIEQLFANLIGNSLKYVDPQRAGVIEIGALSLPHSANGSDTISMRTYFVKDNGLGIPVACHEKIFQAFQRAHPELAPGEGMGLTIVKRIVERHGGQIWLESAEGQGSTFFVTLPADPLCDDVPSSTGHPAQKGLRHDNRTDGHPVGGRR